MLELAGVILAALAAFFAGGSWLYAFARDRAAEVPEFAVQAFRDAKPGWGFHIVVARPSALPLWAVEAVEAIGDPSARVATNADQIGAGGVRRSEGIGAGGQRWRVEINTTPPLQYLHEYELRVLGVDEPRALANLRLRFKLVRPGGVRRWIEARIPNPRPRDGYI
jgi:hypothetical protein